MKLNYTLKKILPGLLIVMILSVGIFGVFNVQTAHAAAKDVFAALLGAVGIGPMVFAEMYVGAAFSWIGQMVLSIFSLFVGISGWILDWSVTYTIMEMGTHVDDIGFIEEGWKMFRDLANIMLIFALLVIGIATILRVERYGMKALLAKLIVVALLINFSLFFTQVVIDASNLLALQFYEKMAGDGWTGIGYAYMDAFKLTTLYDANGVFNPTVLTKGLTVFQIILVTVSGSIVFLVAAFAFLAGAFLLIGRFVALIFLMVLSPLAFVGMILPKTQEHASRWWSALFNYSFFAPAYLLLTWFVINVINSDAFRDSIGLSSNTNLATAMTGGARAIESIPIVVNFILVIFFMLASIIIANKMGIAGSSAVMSWGKSARKWGQGVVGGATLGTGGRIMRTTVGRGASKLADSEKIKNRAASGGVKGMFGRMQLRGLRGVAGSSFDVRATKAGGAIAGAASLGKAGGKGGYEEKLKQQIKSREKFARDVIGKESLNERLKKEKLEKATKTAKETFEDTQKREKETKSELEQAVLPETKANVQAKLDVITKEKEAAQEMFSAAEKVEKDFKPGIGRQQQYAKTLETEKTIDRAFVMIPRKGKEAAVAIRKNIKEAPNKKILDTIGKQLKANESGAGEPKEKPESESSTTT